VARARAIPPASRRLADAPRTIVAAHCHPSGDPRSSAEDIALTKRLQAAGELLGIQLLDHVIVTDTATVSMLDRGLL
jgi:DNA repair protein RadC